MSKRGDKEYLQDILVACKNILSYTEGYDYDMFLEDRKTQDAVDAVIRNIEIIGEAAKNVSESLKKWVLRNTLERNS